MGNKRVKEAKREYNNKTGIRLVEAGTKGTKGKVKAGRRRGRVQVKFKITQVSSHNACRRRRGRGLQEEVEGHGQGQGNGLPRRGRGRQVCVAWRRGKGVCRYIRHGAYM